MTQFSPRKPEESASPMTRRLLIAGAAAAPLVPPEKEPETVRVLIDRARRKNDAFVSGDIERWHALVGLSSDFSLLQPFGGPASFGFDARPERLAELSRYFQNGEATLEVLCSYASADMTVLVMIERQTCEVGGLPKQDWSLRVTEVYQREGAEWRLAHRHADPLVRRIALEQAAALARGAAAN